MAGPRRSGQRRPKVAPAPAMAYPALAAMGKRARGADGAPGGNPSTAAAEAVRRRIRDRLFHRYLESSPGELYREDPLIRRHLLAIELRERVKAIPVLGEWARRLNRALRGHGG